VVASVVWVGGTTLAIYAVLTLRQNTPAELASFARKAALIGERVYIPPGTRPPSPGFTSRSRGTRSRRTASSP
jgi:hypothetical protein